MGTRHPDVRSRAAAGPPDGLGPPGGISGTPRLRHPGAAPPRLPSVSAPCTNCRSRPPSSRGRGGRPGARRGRGGAVRLRVGELAGVVPRLAAVLLRAGRRDLLAGAELLVENVPGRARCGAAARSWPSGRRPRSWLPSVRAPPAELLCGRELEMAAVTLPDRPPRRPRRAELDEESDVYVPERRPPAGGAGQERRPGARALREELAARGVTVVNMLSSPGSGKTELLELGCSAAPPSGGCPSPRSPPTWRPRTTPSGWPAPGAPVKQVLTGGLCHLEAAMLARPPGGLAADGHPAAVRGERRQPRVPRLLRPRRDAAGGAGVGHRGRGQAAEVPDRVRARRIWWCSRRPTSPRPSASTRRPSVRNVRAGQPGRGGAAHLGPHGTGRGRSCWTGCWPCAAGGPARTGPAARHRGRPRSRATTTAHDPPDHEPRHGTDPGPVTATGAVGEAHAASPSRRPSAHARHGRRARAGSPCAASSRAWASGRSSTGWPPSWGWPASSQRRRRRGGRGRGRPGGRRGVLPPAPATAAAAGRGGPRSATRADAARAAAGSRIRPSEPAATGRTLVPPDTATCDDCLRELRRPGATAATGTRSSPAPTAGPGSPSSPGCPTTGPRPPWPAFPMCPECAAEYARPGRPPLPRPAGGLPRLRAPAAAAPPPATAPARPTDGDAARRGPAAAGRGARSWRSRGSAATTSPATPPTRAAVAALRARKDRGGKPFAVMCADLADGRAAGRRRPGGARRC